MPATGINFLSWYLYMSANKFADDQAVPPLTFGAPYSFPTRVSRKQKLHCTLQQSLASKCLAMHLLIMRILAINARW